MSDYIDTYTNEKRSLGRRFRIVRRLHAVACLISVTFSFLTYCAIGKFDFWDYAHYYPTPQEARHVQYWILACILVALVSGVTAWLLGKHMDRLQDRYYECTRNLTERLGNEIEAIRGGNNDKFIIDIKDIRRAIHDLMEFEELKPGQDYICLVPSRKN